MANKTDERNDTTPEAFKARALNMSLTLKDVQASQDWYRDVIGFTVDQEFEREGKLRSVALKAGDVRFILNQDDGAKGWNRTKGEGFSFMFTTVPDGFRFAISSPRAETK